MGRQRFEGTLGTVVDGGFVILLPCTRHREDVDWITRACRVAQVMARLRA